MKKKYITAHFGSRDNYELSLALAKGGLLDKLITDFYCPDLFRKILTKRYNNKLSSRYTISSYELLIKNYFSKNNSSNDSILSELAYEYAQKRKSSLFLYSYYAYTAFNKCIESELPIERILFQLHPHPNAVRKILNEEIRKFPYAKKSIMIEPEFNLSELKFRELTLEAHLANKIFVASTYTKRTLIDDGVSAEKIHVVPYGVDTFQYRAKTNYNSSGKLRLIFIGQIVQRKGVIYLMEALSKYRKHVELFFANRSNVDFAILDNYKDFVSYTILSDLDNFELNNLMHTCDAMILPSLLEGFGLVILESMASGLPVICTDHTAGPDLITNQNEGFIIPIRDSDAIAEVIDNILLNRSILRDMGRNARMTAEKFSWDRFRLKIKNITESM
jgi:glycosyltransferase involved in cell wall biosynthesis